MYWALNSSRHYDAHGQLVPKGVAMKPDEWSEMRMANARMRTAIPIDERFASPGDSFVSCPGAVSV